MYNLTCSVKRIEVFRYFRLISDPSVIKRIKNTPTIKLLNKNKSNDELLQKTPQKNPSKSKLPWPNVLSFI